MTRFNAYLIEDRLTPVSRSKKIGKDEVISILRTKASDIFKYYMSLPQGSYIYRGIQNIQEYIVTDPTKGKPRRSIDITNYYTLLMDNLPSWKKYPKRSRSIICTTSYHDTSEYGNAYIVFPFNNAKIGMCPLDDIWISFASTVGDLTHFINLLQSLLRATTKIKDWDKDWNTLAKAFKESEKYLQNEGKESLRLQFFKNYKWFEEISNGKSYIDAFNELMDPSKNNFKLKKPGDKLTYDARELWVGNAPSLLIADGWWDETVWRQV